MAAAPSASSEGCQLRIGGKKFFGTSTSFASGLPDHFRAPADRRGDAPIRRQTFSRRLSALLTVLTGSALRAWHQQGDAMKSLVGIALPALRESCRRWPGPRSRSLRLRNFLRSVTREAG